MDLIGHDNVKKRVKIAVNSANLRNSCIPHILLAGAAGCGKTTTAQWLANLGDYDFLPVSPLSLKTKKDVYSLLNKLNTIGYNAIGDRVDKIKPTIIFFDEVHQMPVIGQEILGIAMESFILESDEANKMIWLPYFSIVGATTDDGILTKPFRERFKIKFIYEPYANSSMYSIIHHHAEKNKVVMTPKAVRHLTARSRGIPRIMISYLETIRDFMISNKASIITSALVDSTFETIGIDETGLNKVDITILKTLYSAEKPIGLENLAIVTNESAKSLSQTAEPYLIRRGFILRTGKGRAITSAGRRYVENYGIIGNKNKTQKVFIDVSHKRK